MGFFDSLFGGQNVDLNRDIGQSAQVAGFGIGQGEKNITKSSNFWSDVLSGDSSKMMAALAPQINAIKGQSAQDRKTTTEFGNRGGGTAASNAASNDKVHGYIANLFGSLTGNAATELGNMGSSLLSQGASSLSQNAGFSQQRMQNWQNSILGHGITQGVQAAESLGMGAAGGALPGGPGAAAGAQGAFASFLNR